MISVQPHDAMGELRDKKEYVRLTLINLPFIRAYLVRLLEGRQVWDFPRLVETLRNWTDCSPKVVYHSVDESQKRENIYQTNAGSIFCEKSGHRTSECRSAA